MIKPSAAISAILVTTVFFVSACAQNAPAPAPKPAPQTVAMSGASGGKTGEVSDPTVLTPSPVAPPPRDPSLVTTSQKALQSAPEDTSDWIDSSWKLFKSSINTTFTGAYTTRKIRSPQGSLTFSRYPVITFDVSNMNVVDEYKSPMHEPNVEHLIPMSPAEAMHIWVKDRIRTSGDDSTLQIVIKDASVVASAVPMPEGAETHDRRYDARLEVEMRIYGKRIAMSEASITVVATQTNTIPEEASLAERKAVFKQMLFDLMDSANAELEKQIFKYMTRYINYAQTP